MTIGAEQILNKYKSDRVAIALAVLMGKLNPDHHVNLLLNETSRWAAEIKYKEQQQKCYDYKKDGYVV
jgi:hypothetical protein